MQSRTCQVGPLVAATATKLGLSQTPAAKGGLVLNGADGSAVANGICLSQSGVTATPLLINGALSQTRYVSPTSGVSGATIAWLPVVSPVYITSAGDDHTVTFAVVGMDSQNATVSETVTGTNTSVVATVNSYKAILSVTPSANTASTVTVGAMGFATLDTPRRILFTPGSTGTARTIALSGTDITGYPISETISIDTGGDAVYSVLDYATVTSAVISGATGQTIEIGTNGVAGSQWISLDSWASAQVAGQCVVSGTVNYTVQTTNDDPNSYSNPVSRSSVTWDTTFADLIGATTSSQFNLAVSPVWIRILLNSNTNPGFVRMALSQSGSVSY